MLRITYWQTRILLYIIFGYVFAAGPKGETSRITPLPALPGPQGPDGLPGPPGVPGEYIHTTYRKKSEVPRQGVLPQLWPGNAVGSLRTARVVQDQLYIPFQANWGNGCAWEGLPGQCLRWAVGQRLQAVLCHVLCSVMF